MALAHSTPDNSTRAPRDFESVAGIWKLACALAVLFGHNLVTLTAAQPGNLVWRWAYHLVQFFSPLHFFLFSGYLAASGLMDLRRPLRPMMVTRGLRIYVLVVAALAWGLVSRILVKRWVGTDSLGTVWPLGVWDGPVDFVSVLRHLNPFGFADHVQFNYATWYLYQELRIVLLFPVFRWILLMRSSFSRWSWAGILLALSAVLEYLFWSHFPLFRSSPFQSLSFGVYFLSGALLWMELRPGTWLSKQSSSVGFVILLAGIAIAFLESFGIRPPVKSPAALMVTILVGQILTIAGLRLVFGNFPVKKWLRRACDFSVGIYIIHPPIHVLAVWMSLSGGVFWPIPAGIALSIAGGVVFHIVVEAPSQTLVKRIAGWIG